MFVEVCANGLQSALNAERAGADRVELCVELGVGGITPSYGLIEKTRELLSIPIHVLVRPRSGHFTYTEEEFEVMCADVAYCKKVGVDGIVSGVLLSDNTLDGMRTQELVTLAGPLHFTFHRAFDWVEHPVKVLEQLEAIGVGTVLSSGQRPTALEGIDFMAGLQQETEMVLMPGGGINLGNVLRFKETGFKAVHFSATSFEGPIVNTGAIAMNADKHLNEHEVAVTSSALVRQMVQLLKP